jgi:hypothetical protein
VQLYGPDDKALPVQDFSEMQRSLQTANQNTALLTERLAELELAMEDQGWRQLITGGQREFSRAGLLDIMRLSRLMYLKNPLIRRSVDVQAQYVWGRGVNIAAEHPDVNDVVQAFLDDPKNKAELTSHQARMLKEVDLQVTGNIFFVLFSDVSTGAVKIRTLPVYEVSSIISNPDDAKDPWFYKREWEQVTYAEQTGAPQPRQKIAYYPAWSHDPDSKPPTMYGQPVQWDSPVYHVKVGGLSDMQFGVPEVYAALDWAKAYKEFLEDWCSLNRAYARFAWRYETVGGARGVGMVSRQLSTSLGTGDWGERNPPPNVGSTIVQTAGQKLDPIKTAGATTGPEEGRRILLMVAAATGLPETFFGDASVGTVATAKSLDRPTELKMLDRQTLWAEVLLAILDYVIDRAAQAPNGPLAGKTLVKGTALNAGDGDTPLTSDPLTGEAIDRSISVSFPALLEHDVVAQVAAIVQAATFNGYQLAGTIDLKTVSKMLLNELGAKDVDEILELMFPDDEAPITGKPQPDAVRLAKAALPPPGRVPSDEPADPNDPNNGLPVGQDRTETESVLMRRAATEFREAIAVWKMKYAGA